MAKPRIQINFDCPHKALVEEMAGKADKSLTVWLNEAILEKAHAASRDEQLEIAQADAAHDRVVTHRLMVMVARMFAQVNLLVDGSALPDDRRQTALAGAAAKVAEIYGPARLALIEEYAQLLKAAE